MGELKDMKGIIFTKPTFWKNIFNRKSRGITKFDIRKNAMFLLMCVFLIIGIVIGVICAGNGDKSLTEKLDFLFVTNFENRKTMGAFSLFSASFASGFIFLLVVFLLGISAWGFFALPAVPLFKGFGFGLSTGYMYGAYGFYGVLYNLLIILPGAFIAALVIIVMSKDSFRFSWELMMSMRGFKNDISGEFKLYIIRIFWALLILAGSSIADMLLSLIFSGLFSFS